MRLIPSKIMTHLNQDNAYVLLQSSPPVQLTPEDHFSFYKNPTICTTVASFVRNTWNELSQPHTRRPLTQAGVAHCQNEAWVVGVRPKPVASKGCSTIVGSTLNIMTLHAPMDLGSALTTACCIAAKLGAVELITLKEPDRLYDTVFFEFGITESISKSNELCHKLKQQKMLDAELYIHQPNLLKRLAALEPDDLDLTHRQLENLEWFFGFVLNNLRVLRG